MSRETRLRRLLFIYFYNYADSRETTAIASKIMLHLEVNKRMISKVFFIGKCLCIKITCLLELEIINE